MYGKSNSKSQELPLVTYVSVAFKFKVLDSKQDAVDLSSGEEVPAGQARGFDSGTSS